MPTLYSELRLSMWLDDKEIADRVEAALNGLLDIYLTRLEKRWHKKLDRSIFIAYLDTSAWNDPAPVEVSIYIKRNRPLSPVLVTQIRRIAQDDNTVTLRGFDVTMQRYNPEIIVLPK